MAAHVTASRPVFFDPSGRRWRWALCGAILSLFSVVLMAAWLTPQQLAPIWPSEQNGSISYPQTIAELDDTLPVMGTGVFTRIAQVEQAAGQTYLVDPFSNKRLRELSYEETADIGSHRFVQERFGTVPDRQLLLTFDDGPDANVTPALLDILSRNQVPATFFTIGKNVLHQPELFKRIIREGHMVGNHTFTHIDFDEQLAWQDREELIATDHVGRQIAGYASRLFRLPYGDEDKNILGILHAQQLGYLQTGFDIDTHDWEYSRDQTVPLPALDGKGHVVLMHDGGGNHVATLALTQKLINEAKAQGYTFTTFAPLLDKSYLSTKVTPSATDFVTWAGLWAFFVLPNNLTSWLTWFGVTALLLISALRIVLALVNHRRQHMRHTTHTYKPFVSVIMAAHNEEAVLAKTLTALEKSLYPSYEVIAVNDGSTDDTLGLLRDFASIWQKLRVIDQQPNLGKSVALNKGIAAANGEIIVTLDADTIFMPNTIGNLVRHFVDPSVGVVAGHIKVGNCKNLLTRWQSLEYLSGICVTRMAEDMLGAIMVAPGACAAWRKYAILGAGGYPSDTLAEDSDLTLAIQRLGWRVTQDNDAVALTEAPMTMHALAKQRLRWTYGNFQVWYKHRGVMLRPKYGWLGMFVMPYALLTVLMSLVFLPLVYITAAMSIESGNWHSIALFATLVMVVHFATSLVAVRMTHERLGHLLLVPIYRFIYEPLWFYLLYASALKAIRGRAVGWYSPARTNSVVTV